MPNPVAAAYEFTNRTANAIAGMDEKEKLSADLAKIMSRHEINASSHHASPTNHNINSQEILKFLTSGPSRRKIYLYLLDDLEEKGLKPSDQTLRQFGVKNFGTNTEIGKEIIDNNYVDAFYRSNNNSIKQGKINMQLIF